MANIKFKTLRMSFIKTTFTEIFYVFVRMSRNFRMGGIDV